MNVFGFFTDDKLYSKHADLLKQSFEIYDCNIELLKVKSKEWQDIIALKPSYINEAYKKSNKKLLFLDVDAFLCSDILSIMMDIEEDIAVHYLNDIELISSTMLFNKTNATDKLLEEWVKRSKLYPEIWDQKILQEIIKEMVNSNDITLKKIGPEFTYIFDISEELYGDSVKPNIIHLQASRDKRLSYKFKSLGLFEKVIFLINPSNTRVVRPRHKYCNKLAKKIGSNIRFNLLDIF